MMFFPGWPGPVFGGRQHGIAPVQPPAFPMTAPSRPPGHPPGPYGAPPPHAPPATAHVAQTPPPPGGLAAYGVPVSRTGGGRPVIYTPQRDVNAPPVPPDLPGMPKMPSPQNWFPQTGGLFEPVSPVPPFNHGNQVTPPTR